MTRLILILCFICAPAWANEAADQLRSASDVAAGELERQDAEIAQLRANDNAQDAQLADALEDLRQTKAASAEAEVTWQAKVAALQQQLTECGGEPVPPVPQPPTTDAFWTQFPLAADARVIHVSATGNDAGNGTAAAPVKTRARIDALTRNGTGDHVLFKAGDTFGGAILLNWSKSGKAGSPLLISSYGTGARPKFNVTDDGFSINSTGKHDIALVGLHFKAAKRDPSAPGFDATSRGNGIQITQPVANFLIEDCKVEFFEANITFSSPSDDLRHSNIKIRRSVITDAWGTAGGYVGQGIFIERADGVLLEQNLIDHNGWNESISGASANMFRHGAYLSHRNTNVRSLGNIVTRNASHGIWQRSGGDVWDNLFSDNAIACQIAGTKASALRNVFLGGRDISSSLPRGTGLTLYAGDAVAANNIFLNNPTQGNALEIQDHTDFAPAGPRKRSTIERNVVKNWTGNAIDVSAPRFELNISGNDIKAGSKKIITLKVKPVTLSAGGNTYDLNGADTRFAHLGVTMTAAKWMQTVGEVGSTLGSLEHDAALPADFLQQARQQSKATWNPQLTAEAVNAQIGAAFQ